MGWILYHVVLELCINLHPDNNLWELPLNLTMKIRFTNP
ncbi:hypothetical protein LEP1GSC065_2737 [Leptospira kirschneri serovar Sokoine str. RM1]|nr:hypothetical protein LEP1GSC065_2737 [Leptospira kirschneri serovar Sokoine str. RM1]EMO79943.1 hypothetical protein LEP1GSC126_0996 [Leptospira kirschneri str. 200801774]